MTRGRSILYRALLSLAAGVAVLLIAGSVYQWLSTRRDADDFPMPGGLYDIGGRSLHLYCTGAGSVTVLLESGLTGSFAAWRLVQPGIARFAHVCSYDRAGMGWSDPVAEPTHTERVADDLVRLLDAASMDGPLLLVGWSAGGVYNRAFFARHTRTVVGMVLVDSAHEAQGVRLPADPSFDATLGTLRVCSALAPFGIVRLLGAMDAVLSDVSLPAEARAEQLALLNRTGYCRGAEREMTGFREDVQSRDGPASLGALPLVVISRGRQLTVAELPPGSTQHDADTMNAAWSELQNELTSLSSHAEHWVARRSRHGIPYEQPEIIVAAVRKLLAEH